jgi:lactoylglutathione lyase
VESRFNHIALYVSNLKKSSAFYQEVIGGEVIGDPFRDDRHVWLKIGEHNQLHLISQEEPPRPTDDFHFAFSVASLDDFLSLLQQFGFQYDDNKGRNHRIRIRPDNVRQIYLQDPDGYLIEINEDRF